MSIITLNTRSLPDSAVTTAKIAADAITDAKIADDVIGTEHLTAGEVDATALATNAVTTAKIADSAVTAVKTSGVSTNPFRNIIINGDMSIAQRATSETGQTSSGYMCVDRFNHGINSQGTWTITQDTTVPTGQGFAKSMKMDCTTADGSPAAGDYIWFEQKIEGQNLQYLKKGTSSAESVTVSFWVYATKTGTNIVEFYDKDNTRHICKSYTISDSNTWEKKTLTFAGDTSGAFNNDNGESASLLFWIGAGSNYTSGTLATSWASVSGAAANRAVGQINHADSTSNNFYITGIQMEAGTAATDFEFVPFDVNLSRCQRYYSVVTDRRGASTPPRDQRPIGTGVTHYGNQVSVQVFLPVEMRAHPSLDQITGTDYFDYYHDQNSDEFDSFNAFAHLGTSSVGLRNTNQISASAGTCGEVYLTNTTGLVAFDSEL